MACILHAKLPLNRQKPQNNNSPRLLFCGPHLLTATFVLQGLKSNPKLLFDRESHHVSIFQCGKNLSEGISSHLEKKCFELEFILCLLNNFWTISQSNDTLVFSSTWYLLHIFPRLAPVVCFPALGIRYVFSRAWQPLCAFPRLAFVTSSS